MKDRTDADMIPTEAVFAVAYHLTRFGSITVGEAADLGGCTRGTARRILNKASRKGPITRIKPGHWAVTDEVSTLAEQLRPLLQLLRSETEGKDPYSGYCHPLTRKQAATLLHALELLLREKA
ncbi:MAG: hypothetical protein ACRC1H_13790 [Caldilineaceae bacterium]